MDIDELQNYARIRALELILSTLLAGAAMNDRQMLDRMHEALSNLLRDAAKNLGAAGTGLSAAQQMLLTETMAQTLDDVIGGAKALR